MPLTFLLVIKRNRMEKQMITMLKRFVHILPLMNRFINFIVPMIASISFVLLLNPSGLSLSSYGQIVGDASQTNQMSDQNSIQQTQQQLEEANQQLAQANQTQQQVSNQTQQQLEEANQTQPQPANQTQPQPDPEMVEKLLNYTNVAILALNEDDTSAAQDNIVQIQNALINASGKQVVIIPAPAILTSDEDSD